QVARALIHLQRERFVCDKELKERVTRRECRLLDLAGVPSIDDDPPAVRILSDQAYGFGELIDLAPTPGTPMPPLDPVDPADVAVEPRLRLPVIGFGVGVPDPNPQTTQIVDVRAAGDEPQQLGLHRLERDALGGDDREAVAHGEA